MRPVLVVLITLSFCPAGNCIGTPTRPDSAVRTACPDSQYEAGWLHSLVFGKHWRDLWCTEIEVEVLDLERFAGGLTPLKRGGGRQTKTLKFLGADGREYKFRSMAKDPGVVLPPELRRSIAADLLQDQISSANPLAPVIVSPLINAAGVLNAPPRLIFLPSSPGLGEFQSEYGGLLGTIEENPNEADEDSASFAGAGKVIGTMRFLDHLEDDHDERADSREFLKARLVDIYVGDWDRHFDQWRWAGYEDSDGDRLWMPVPRDRDQAFCRLDGIVPWLATYLIPEVKGFDEDYPAIEDLTWTGRFLDRRLLAGVEWAVWDSLTRFVESRLTDSVIDAAVRLLPAPMYALEGEGLVRMLKVRRSGLPDASRDFYLLCSAYPEIYGSNKREYADIVHHPGGRTSVTLSKRNKETGGPGEPFFSRTFSSDETNEVRIHLLGSDDVALIRGERTGSLGVKIIGGKGDDEMIDSSTGGGLADIAPFTLFSTPPTAFYDQNKDTKYRSSGYFSFSRAPAMEPSSELERYAPPLRDYGYEWWFMPWYGYSPDQGFFIGGGPIFYKYGFRVDPSVYRMQLRGGYATKIRKFRVDYDGDFHAVVPGELLNLHIEYSGIEGLNYFGAGNTSVKNDSLFDSGFYRAGEEHLLLRSALEVSVTDLGSLVFLGGAKYHRPTYAAGTILDLTQPAGASEPASFVHAGGGLKFDSRDYPRAALSGFYMNVSAASHFPLTAGYGQFQELDVDVRAYLNAGTFPLTLALRGVGKKLWGTYPYYESAFLGGISSLRGYESERFAGDAALSGSAEARARLLTFDLLVPSILGLLLTGEAGRVYVSGETSEVWHGAVGAGFWIAFVNQAYVMSVSAFRSPETTGVYLTAGFGF